MHHYTTPEAAGTFGWRQLRDQLRRRRSRRNRAADAPQSAGVEALEPRLLLTAVAIDSVQRLSELPGNGDLNAASFDSSLSRDGQFLVFTSAASNIVPNDTNGVEDIFLLDRVTNEYELISVSSAEVQGNFASLEPVITPDGRFVVFRSFATNLDGSNSPEGNIFIRDRAAGTTGRVSVTGGLGAFQPSISDDGRFVAYHTIIDGATQIVLHDREAIDPAPDSIVITESPTLGFGNGDSGGAVVSGNGQFVVFHSVASNLIDVDLDGLPDDVNGVSDIFRYDVTNAVLEQLITGNGASLNPDISANGQFVVFESDATNLFPMDNNGRRDVILFTGDGTGGGNFQLISKIDPPMGGQPIQGNADSFTPKISDSGRFVTFASASTNWFNLDFPTVQIYVTDESKDLIRLLTFTRNVVDPTNPFEGGNANSTMPAISSDGTIVSFQSAATNLDVNDTNGVLDIYGAPTDFIQPLEVDIAGQIVSLKLAESIVTGESPRNAGLQLLISNQGISSAVAGQLIDIEVYLRPIGGGSDILIGEQENLNISGLDPGRSRSVNIRLDIPTTVPSGSYEIFTVVDANREVIEEVDFDDSVIFASQDLLVANAFVDLQPQFDFEQPSLLVPGDRLRQRVVINNAGNVDANGVVLVRLLASDDPFADPGDVVLTEREMRLRARPGRPVNVNFNLRSFPALPPGQFFLLADVQPLSGDPELLEDVSALAVSDDTVQVLNQFGSVGDRNGVRLVQPGAGGEDVIFSLTGSGTGTVTPTATGFDLALTGTNQNSRLRITTRGETVVLNNIVSDNSIGTLGANRGVDLEGAITVNGSVEDLLFEDITNSTINISGALGDLRADEVTNSNLTVGTMLGRATVGTWQGGSLTAGSVDSLRANGSRDADTADLNLNVSLTDALVIESIDDVRARGVISGNWAAAAGVGNIRGGSLEAFNANFAGGVDRIQSDGDVSGNMTMLWVNDFRVNGDLTGADIMLTQGASVLQSALDTLTVRGLIVNTTLRAAGNIDRVTAGAMVDSNLFAGVSLAETGLPDSAADFVSPAVIESVQLRGVRGRDFEFEGSNIAASALGDIRLGNVNPDNGGVPFGLATQTFDRIEYILNGDRISARDGDTTPLVTAGDFMIRIL